MAMTPKGIYFPEGTTNANFVSIFSTLAASIDAALGDFTYDSGWIDVATNEMSNGWTTYNTSSFQVAYRRVGKWVYHRGLIRYGTEASEMYTVPDGFRPSKGTEIFYCMTSGSITGSGGYKGTRIDVRVSGTVSQVGSNTALGNGFISLSNIGYYID